MLKKFAVGTLCVIAYVALGRYARKKDIDLK